MIKSALLLKNIILLYGYIIFNFKSIKILTKLMAISFILLTPNISQSEEIIGEYWLTNGFYSHHLTSRKFNEDNVGIGVQLKLNNGIDKYDSISIGTFKNSISKRTNYIIYNYMPFAWEYVQFGLSAGFLNGYNFNNNNYFPVLIPTAQFNYKRTGMNITFLPKVNNESASVIAIQFKIKL